MVRGHPCCGAGVSRAELRRRKLIDVARKLFIENGFHATGIAQIARESGIAVGQIYRDFSSKEDIVAALVAVDCGRFQQAEALRVALRAGDADQVRRWLHHLVEPDDDVEGGRMFAEILAESSRNRRVAAIVTAVQDELRANLLAALELLAPGEPLKERRDTLADTIMTVSLGLLHHRLMRPGLEVLPLAREFRTVIDERIEALNPSRAYEVE